MSFPQSSIIEAEFQRLNRLRFSPALEARFDAEGLVQRKRLGRITLMIGIMIFDAFLVSDWQVLPDVFAWLVAARLGIFTTLGLAILWIQPRTTTPWQVDTMVVFGALVAVLIPMSAIVVSGSPYILIYQFGSMITITYFTLVQRVRFRFAAVGLVLAPAIQLACVGLRPEIDLVSYQFVVNFYVSGAVLLLTGCYVLERAERQNILERTRGEFLIEHIERAARTDLLTGLSNRHHLASLAADLADRRTSGPIAALMIDIDHFKRFNDARGHIAGDGCIRAVATAVRQTLGEAGGESAGHAFRFGGEEFLLLLPGRDLLQGAALGEAIRRRLQASAIPHPAMGGNAVVTVSVGVATGRAEAFSLDTLVGDADAALYRAKRGGRNRLVVAA